MNITAFLSSARHRTKIIHGLLSLICALGLTSCVFSTATHRQIESKYNVTQDIVKERSQFEGTLAPGPSEQILRVKGVLKSGETLRFVLREETYGIPFLKAQVEAPSAPAKSARKISAHLLIQPYDNPTPKEWTLAEKLPAFDSHKPQVLLILQPQGRLKNGQGNIHYRIYYRPDRNSEALMAVGGLEGEWTPRPTFASVGLHGLYLVAIPLDVVTFPFIVMWAPYHFGSSMN